MDLVHLMYRYINRFINSTELLEELLHLNLDSYPLDEKKQVQKLILDIQNINNKISNEVDELEMKRLLKLDKLLDLFDEVKLDYLDDEEKKLFLKMQKSLFDDKNKDKDSGLLYETVFHLLTNHELICKYARQMNDLELLDFITQYISVPFPPVLTQNDFNELVKVGIKYDEREKLWRLAFNYGSKGMDFSLIEDYFLLKKDAYYLIELISAVSENLNMENLICKLIDLGDKEFLYELVSYHIFDYLSFDDITFILKKGKQKKLFSSKEIRKLESILKK